jgi:hypothetical protein
MHRLFLVDGKIVDIKIVMRKMIKEIPSGSEED